MVILINKIIFADLFDNREKSYRSLLIVFILVTIQIQKEVSIESFITMWVDLFSSFFFFVFDPKKKKKKRFFSYLCLPKTNSFVFPRREIIDEEDDLEPSTTESIQHFQTFHLHFSSLRCEIQ